MNGVGRITENKWMRRLRSDLRIVLDLILRSDLRFGPAQNKHLVVRTDGHWPFRASGLLEPLARLAKEGEKSCRASGPAVNVEACSQCKRRLTCSPKRMDSTNHTRLPAVARAHCDVFQAGLPWQWMAKLYKGSIFVITETQFAFQSQVT